VAVLAESEPRNVRLRAQVVGDSIYFRLQWNAPPRGTWDTPIEGYDWELRGSSDGVTLGTLYDSGATLPNDRRVDRTVAFDCINSPTYFTARVRATGNFSDPAPWGLSDPFLMACNTAPPGPPVVDLDTIPADTISTPPDSMVFRPVELGEGVEYDAATGRFRFTAYGATAKVCGLAYRGSLASLPSRGSWVATVDSTVVTKVADAFIISETAADEPCWFWTARADGEHEAYLCTTDCPPAIAGWLPALPASWRLPLVLLGFFLIIIDMRATRRLVTRLKKRK
jgi:hypothetical protein